MTTICWNVKVLPADSRTYQLLVAPSTFSRLDMYCSFTWAYNVSRALTSADIKTFDLWTNIHDMVDYSWLWLMIPRYQILIYHIAYIINPDTKHNQLIFMIPVPQTKHSITRHWTTGWTTLCLAPPFWNVSWHLESWLRRRFPRFSVPVPVDPTRLRLEKNTVLPHNFGTFRLDWMVFGGSS